MFPLLRISISARRVKSQTFPSGVHIQLSLTRPHESHSNQILPFIVLYEVLDTTSPLPVVLPHEPAPAHLVVQHSV